MPNTVPLKAVSNPFCALSLKVYSSIVTNVFIVFIKQHHQQELFFVIITKSLQLAYLILNITAL